MSKALCYRAAVWWTLPAWMGVAEAACRVDAWDTRVRSRGGVLLREDRITLGVEAEVAACADWAPPGDFGEVEAARWVARGGALRARRGSALRPGADGRAHVWMPGLFEGDRVQLVVESVVRPGDVWAPGVLGALPWARLRWDGPRPAGQPRTLLRGPLPADGVPGALRVPLGPARPAAPAPAPPAVVSLRPDGAIAWLDGPSARGLTVVDGQVWLADLVGPIVTPGERWVAWPVADPVPAGDSGPGYAWACTVEEQRAVCRVALSEGTAAPALARSLAWPVAVSP